ncbi:penicillin-binding protein PBP4 [Staphylococcus carnosus]|uniref:penicillin-binding protein PBP4 n=1 Tax=Staphylococcus carnosus TaxID=1281 RepID=UPI00081A746A|nr:penicillin-binding protein PBP4 [Staphylococcus carnosus]ANZ34410.1 penicillin-binding protein [Staphylococcus carnosus]UTB84269.1 penicillin-binding protein [Staphylococcus carnosus]
MNKVLSIVISFLLLWTLFITPNIYAQQTPTEIAKQHHQPLNTQYNPKSAYVITQQGQILYNYHGNQSIDPASTTKLMTVYLVLEAIEQGKIKPSDSVKITPSYEKLAQLPNLTTFPLKNKQTYTIDQLLKQAMLESSNAATLVLADKLSGDTSKFTDNMNAKAKELGMKHSHFTNPSGANNLLIQQFAPKAYKSETFSHSTAQDMTILSKAIIKNYPKVLQYSSLKTDQQYGKKLTNTNLSLPGSQDALNGAQGLKTGTSDNGYNLVLTTKRNNLRIDTTVMNVQPYPSETSKHARQKIANALTEDAYKHYEYRKVISKGEHELDGKTYDVKQDLYDVVPKDKNKYKLKIKNDKLQIDYPRQFLKGSHVPSVKVEHVAHWGKLLVGAATIIGGVLLVSAIIYIVVKRRN